MYLAVTAVGRTLPAMKHLDPIATELAAMFEQQETILEWLGRILKASWHLMGHVLGEFGTWFARACLWIFEIPVAGTFQAISDAYFFLQQHPHPFHVTGWSIFFGPIIVLVPCLLLLEILILILFHLGFVFHGLIPGSIEDRFDELKEYFMDTRESIYATVENWTAVFNKWTMEYPPLLILRLIAGATSFLIFVGIWNGWS